MILIDTHVLLWQDNETHRLGPLTFAAIKDASAGRSVAISSITIWEVGMLISKGRYELAAPLKDWRADLLHAGLNELPVTGEIALASHRLGNLHSDPADRLILATAAHHDMPLYSADERLLDWPGPVELHDARH